MKKNFKTDFQLIHYSKKEPNFFLKPILNLASMGYSAIIKTKNFLYQKNILKEKKVNAYVICVGNLTTGGVGKTPIVIELANKLEKKGKKVAIVSRGYGAKLSNKKPNVIKDLNGLKFNDGALCGDEPFQIAKKTNNSTVITCANRALGAEFAIVKYGVDTIILDDGFSNRKIKKDKTIIAIDSKMRFGNGHLLPYGPLREPLSEIVRADEIILVNKNDDDINSSINWAKGFKKPLKLAQMQPKRIYNIQSHAQVKLNNEKAVAFCAIGQPEQFFHFAREFYKITPIVFEDHHKYTKNDIKMLLKKANELEINTFITTQKDETKLIELIKDISNYSFNALELETSIKEIN